MRRFKSQEMLDQVLNMCKTEPEKVLIREMDDPVLWAENHFLDPDTGEDKFKCKPQFIKVLRSNRKDRAVRTGRQVGKCTCEHTRIQLSNGLCPTAEELYAQVGQNGIFNIATTDMSNYKHKSSTGIITDNGIKECIKVITKSGYETTNTHNHPYFILRDEWDKPKWIPGEELKIGDRIANTRNLSEFSVSKELSLLTVDEIKLFENENVPSEIFGSSDDVIAKFIGLYWGKSGYIGGSQYDDSYELSISSYNKELIFGMRTLLLRFGISSNVQHNIPKYDNVKMWQLVISEPMAIWTFKNNIDIDDEFKQKILNNFKLKEFDYDIDMYDSDIVWDIVSDTTNEGYIQTYAISVPETENLITDNFITHNTVHLCVDILHTGYFNKNFTIMVFIPNKKNMDRMMQIMGNLLRLSDMKFAFKINKGGAKAQSNEGIEAKFDYEIQCANGSNIRFFLMKNDPDKARGQSAARGALYIDEVEYLPEKAFAVIGGILKSNPDIHIWASSTPSGLQGTWFREFSDTCNNPDNPDGEEFHLPTRLEENWAVIEPRLRAVIFDEVTWDLEVEANWATAKGAVYKKEIIDAAIERSAINGSYIASDSIYLTQQYQRAPKYLGVDWNNPQNGVRIVEIADLSFGGYTCPWLVRNESIAYETYTQTKAVDRILELYDEHKYKVISVDSGYGEFQIEKITQELVKRGVDPKDVLHVVDCNGGAEEVLIEYESPITKVIITERIKVRMKDRIVMLLGTYLEKELTILKEEEYNKTGIVGEIRNFLRKEKVSRGGFVYSDKTHSLSALQICTHGIEIYRRNAEIRKDRIELFKSEDISKIVGNPNNMNIAHVGFINNNNRSNRMAGLDNGRQRRSIL